MQAFEESPRHPVLRAVSGAAVLLAVAAAVDLVWVRVFLDPQPRTRSFVYLYFVCLLTLCGLIRATLVLVAAVTIHAFWNRGAVRDLGLATTRRNTLLALAIAFPLAFLFQLAAYFLDRTFVGFDPGAGVPSPFRIAPGFLAAVPLLPGLMLNAFPEELVFRGYLHHHGARLLGRWLVVLPTAVLFSLFHFVWRRFEWALFAGFVLAGVLLGLCRLFSGGLLLPTLAHGFMNFLVFTATIDRTDFGSAGWPWNF